MSNPIIAPSLPAGISQQLPPTLPNGASTAAAAAAAAVTNPPTTASSSITATATTTHPEDTVLPPLPLRTAINPTTVTTTTAAAVPAIPTATATIINVPSICTIPKPVSSNTTTPATNTTATTTANTTATVIPSSSSSSTSSGNVNAPLNAEEKRDYANFVENMGKYNTSIWVRLGKLADEVKNPEQALYCYENALRNDKDDTYALERSGAIYQASGQYSLAVERFQSYLMQNSTNGNVWTLLGHCFLALNELQKAFTAYQQAIRIKGPKDASLWYGIGILYERYRMYENAEQSFVGALRIDPNFEHVNEVYLHLGKIYKAQNKMVNALECFKRVLEKLPPGVTMAEILILCAQIYESQGSFSVAIDLYENILRDQPKSVPVLRTLGWLYQAYAEPRNPEKAVAALLRAVDVNQDDALSWYLLGRSWMAQAKYRKAYDAYRQAVYRDSGNASYWCSVGILYYLIGQYRDALDAYSRAVKLDRNMCEVWYNLGTLYETCSQTSDSLDAFKKAAELNPTNINIRLRLEAVTNASRAALGMPPSAAAAAAAQQGKRDPVKEGEPPKLDDRGTPMTMEPPAPISIGGVFPGARKSPPPSPAVPQPQTQAQVQAQVQLKSQVQQQQQQQIQVQVQQQQQQQQQQSVSEALLLRGGGGGAGAGGGVAPIMAVVGVHPQQVVRADVGKVEKPSGYQIQETFPMSAQVAATAAAAVAGFNGNFPPLVERQQQQQQQQQQVQGGQNVAVPQIVQSPVKIMAGEKRPSGESSSDLSSIPLKAHKI